MFRKNKIIVSLKFEIWIQIGRKAMEFNKQKYVVEQSSSV